MGEVQGTDTSSGVGVEGSSTNYLGVAGLSTNGMGVYGQSSATAGESNSGVHGYSQYTAGVWGESVDDMGVKAKSTNYYGLDAHSDNYNAVQATNNRTDHNAAVVTALAGGAGGLSYYGNADIQIVGKYYQNGTCFQGCGSDARLKQNIKPLANAMDTLLQLKGVTYEWKEPAKQGKGSLGTQTGFVAQEVEKNFPQWVDEDGDGFKTLSIRQTEIAALEVESIRQLKLENDALRGRIAALENGGRARISRLSLSDFDLGIGGVALIGAFVFSRSKRQRVGS
jgi:hypothetical protein